MVVALYHQTLPRVALATAVATVPTVALDRSDATTEGVLVRNALGCFLQMSFLLFVDHGCGLLLQLGFPGFAVPSFCIYVVAYRCRALGRQARTFASSVCGVKVVFQFNELVMSCLVAARILQRNGRLVCLIRFV